VAGSLSKENPVGGESPLLYIRANPTGASTGNFHKQRILEAVNLENPSTFKKAKDTS